MARAGPGPTGAAAAASGPGTGVSARHDWQPRASARRARRRGDRLAVGLELALEDREEAADREDYLSDIDRTYYDDYRGFAPEEWWAEASTAGSYEE